MLVSQTSLQMTVACVFIFVCSCIILHKVEMCSFELPQLLLTDMRLRLILTILLCTSIVFYLHWPWIVINELIMQYAPGTWLFTYIQEVASLMERAITHVDDFNIKVLFSSSQKAETHPWHIFLDSMSDWEAGLNNVFQHCRLYSFHLAWKWRESIT